MADVFNNLMTVYPVVGGTLTTTVAVIVVSVSILGYFFFSPKREFASDKCILIAGCCDSGFGEAVADCASRAGFTVLSVCQSDDGSMVRRCNGMENVTTVVADLSTKRGIMTVVEKTKELCAPFGGLYAIVHNASICIPGVVDMLDPAVYEKTMNLMFHAPVALNYELLPLLKKGKGRVIFLSSAAGVVPLPLNAPYGAAQHALEAYCDTLRVEMRPWGVKVVIVASGGMTEPLIQSRAETFKRTYLNASPDRQEQYGQDWLDANVRIMDRYALRVVEDPNIVAGDLLKALLLTNPPARISSGIFANFVMKPLSMLPTSMQDKALFYLMMNNGKPRPKELQ